jgi:hypothetical protein
MQAPLILMEETTDILLPASPENQPETDQPDKDEKDCLYEGKLLLASKRNQLSLSLPQECDLSQSFILLDGEELEELDYEMFLSLKPGIYSLSWQLVDEHGCLIDQDLAEMEIESIAPMLQVFSQNGLLPELSLVKDNQKLFIESDIELALVQVFADGKEIEMQDLSFEVLKGVRSLQVVIEDAFGNRSEKSYSFVNMPALLTPLSTPVYNGLLTLEYGNSLEEGFYLQIGEQKIDAFDQTSLSLLLSKEGNVQIDLMHEKLGLIESYEVNNRFLHPEITFAQSSLKNDIQISVAGTDARDLSLYIKKDGAWVKLSSLEHIASAKEDALSFYEYKAELIDLSGQMHTAYKQVSIDLRQPKMSLLLNGQSASMNQINSFSVLNGLEASFDGTVRNSWIEIDGQKSVLSVYEGLQALQPDQIMQVFYEVEHASKQSAIFSYSFAFEKKQAILQDELLKEDLAFELEKDGSISLAAKPSLPAGGLEIAITQDYKDIDLSKPLSSKDTVRIWLNQTNADANASFESLVINGEEIDESQIQYDSLNQPYYDLELKEKNYEVQVTAIDALGNTLSEEVVFEVELTGFPALLAMAAVVGVMAGIFVLLRRFVFKKRHA